MKLSLRTIVGVFRLAAFLGCLSLFCGNAYAVEEVPGDGIDNDSSGGDASCPAPDEDCDGYSTSSTQKGLAYTLGYGSQTFGEGIDCDDTPGTGTTLENGRYVFPGVSIKGDCSAGEYKTCQENGLYTSCITSAVLPLCEAVDSGVCKYVDPTSGSNSNDGSYASPWATFECFGSYGVGGGGVGAPACITVLPAGSVVYLIGTGTMGTEYNSGNSFGTQSVVINQSGITIKRYPGSTAKVICAADSGIVYGASGDDGAIEGLDVSDCGTAPIRIDTGASNVEVFRNYVHDNDRGNADNNSAAIKVNANADVHHNWLADQGAASGDTQDQQLVTLFSSAGGAKVNLNVLQSTATSAALATCTAGACLNVGGVRFKHAFTYDGTTTFEARGNRGFNLGTTGNGGSAFAISAPSARIMNNYIVDCKAAVNFADTGGADDQRDEIVRYNTFKNCNQYDTDGTFKFQYSGENPVGRHDYDHNIVTVNKSYGSDEGIYRWCYNCSDASYTAWVTAGYLHSSDNCFDNTNGVGDANIKWNLWGSGADLGAQYTGLTAWQAGPIGEANSLATNLTFGTDGVVTTTGCTDKGWQVGWFTTVSAPSTNGSRMMMMGVGTITGQVE